MILALIVIGVSAQRGWLSFIPLATAVFITLAYFLVASLWAIHQLTGQNGLHPHHVLFDMGHIKAQETFVYIDLGIRHQAIALSRRLTTGKIMVLDVYNPQQTPHASLVRLRQRRPPLPQDPRLIWREGNIDLLPIPDKSVPAVMVCQTVIEFWQQGDHLQLLQEIYRILTPNGRLLLAEPVRTPTQWMVRGLMTLRLPPLAYWQNLLQQAGFRIRQEKDLQGLVTCFVAQKPTPSEAQQLSFELDF